MPPPSELAPSVDARALEELLLSVVSVLNLVKLQLNGDADADGVWWLLQRMVCSFRASPRIFRPRANHDPCTDRGPAALRGRAYGDALVALTIVDGMNVIGSRPQTRWWRDRDQAMRDLVADLETLDHDQPMLVVFDGYPITGIEQRDVDVVFAERGGPDGADDLIVELIEDHEAPEFVVVITSDAALRRRVAERGSDVRGPSSLLRRL
jgi:predicted RNA-binding protein with PIN domain